MGTKKPGGRTERATLKTLARGSPGAPLRALAAPVSASYWLAWSRGRSRRQPRPLEGSRIPRAPHPRSSRAVLCLRLGPAAPLGCRSVLQPPARRCVLGSGEERGGRGAAGVGGGGGERKLTHAFQSLHSEQPRDRCRRRCFRRYGSAT